MNAFNKRSRFRFSLSGLLLFPIVLCAPFAWWCQESRWFHLEQAALERLRSEDLMIDFEYCGSLESVQGNWSLVAHTLRRWLGIRNVGSLRLGPVSRGGLPSRDLIAFRRLHSLWVDGLRRDTDLSCLSEYRNLRRVGVSGEYPDDIPSFEAIHSLDTITLYVDLPEGAAANADYLANFSGVGRLRLIISRFPYHEELNGRLKARRSDCHVVNRRSEIGVLSRRLKWTSGCRVMP